MRTILLVWCLIMQVSFLHGQRTVSIYELGDSITDCETNFKNLFANWTSHNITNASSYNLLKYSYVETITDSTRFNYYRNYFSGIEPVYRSGASRYQSSSNGGDIREFFIKPGFIYGEYFDQRGLPPAAREIFTDEFISKAKGILMSDFNIDTISLNHYFYEENKIDTVIKFGPNSNGYSITNHSLWSKGASSDTISKNYIDVFIKGTKSIQELTNSEKRPLMLEQLHIERITKQLAFNQQVHIGDKVYVVDFEYNRKLFRNYIICSAENKKVVMDYFFNGIMLWTDS